MQVCGAALRKAAGFKEARIHRGFRRTTVLFLNPLLHALLLAGMAPPQTPYCLPWERAGEGINVMNNAEGGGGTGRRGSRDGFFSATCMRDGRPTGAACDHRPPGSAKRIRRRIILDRQNSQKKLRALSLLIDGCAKEPTLTGTDRDRVRLLLHFAGILSSHAATPARHATPGPRYLSIPRRSFPTPLRSPLPPAPLPDAECGLAPRGNQRGGGSGLR